MDRDYAEALWGGEGAEGRVYGYRLGALRVVHVAALQAMGSPVLEGGGSAEEVLAAARVCAARSPAEVRRRVTGRLRRLERRVILLRALWYGLGSRRAREARRMREWLARECCGPRVLPGAEGGGRLSSPWTELLVARLCAGGLRRREVWRMRFGLALWADVAAKEAAGYRVRLLSEERVRDLEGLGWTREEIFGGRG